MQGNRAMPRPTSRRSRASRRGAAPKRPISTKAAFTRFAASARKRLLGSMVFKKAKSSFRPSLPLLILLLGLSTVFLFGNDNRDTLYRPGHHNWVSANHLTNANNLSAEHDFLLFDYRTLDDDGGSRIRALQ